jgi:hypothetical protein
VPPNRTAVNTIDNDVATKYLNFANSSANTGQTITPAGFSVTPSLGPTIVTGLTFTLANDVPEHDQAKVAGRQPWRSRVVGAGVYGSRRNPVYARGTQVDSAVRSSDRRFIGCQPSAIGRTATRVLPAEVSSTVPTSTCWNRP